ncbi:MAG: hypothetical protein IKP00_04255 [Victivallales bacterium]|nr:hypothetical protein [Victivallales bacterium]
MQLLTAILKRRRLLWLTTAFAVIAMFLATLLCRDHFTNDLALFFPQDSLSGNMYRTLQESRLTQTIQLEIQFPQAAKNCGTEALGTKLETLDDIALKLSSLQNIASATACFSQGITAPMDDILAAIPYTTSPNLLDSASPATAVANLQKAMALPGTPIDMFRRDPFGLRLQSLELLQQFQSLSGLTTDATDGYLISPDGSRALILLNTDFVRPPNGGDIQTLFLSIEKTVAEILPEAKITIVSPLQHNLENEKIARRDIMAVSLTSFVALLLLFFLLYRGAWNAVLIPLMPLLATIIVTGIMALFFQNLCLFIIGIGGGIAGLAVDQGIHVYAACAEESPTETTAPRSLLRLLPPLILSATTSAAVFLLISLTGISAYVQLGLFAAATLLLNLFLSVTLLPTLLKNHPQPLWNMATFHPTSRLGILFCFIWLFLVIGACCLLPRLKTDFSIRAMDGTSAETIAVENQFQERWLNPEAGAMLVLTADSPEGALQACEKLAENPTLRQTHLFHPASLWPSASIRQRHIHAWRSPETRQKLQQLQQQLQKECAARHLPPHIFDKAFEQLNATLDSTNELSQPPTYQAILRHLLRNYETSTTAIILSDAPRTVPTADILQSLKETPNIALVTADAFQQAASADIRPRLKRLLLLLVPVLLLALFPLLRHPKQLFIIAMPGATALLIGGGLAAAFGYKLTLVSLFSLVMLTGLVLDYGIFALHIAQSKERTSVTASLVLSATTTVLTTGALLASKHPVLFHTGMVLSVGILLTSLTALFIVPSLLRCTGKSFFRLLPLLIITCTTGCMSSLTPQSMETLSRPSQVEISRFNDRFYAPSTRLYSMKTNYLWYEFTMLVAIKTDGNSIQAIGTAPNGVTLFSVAGNAESETKRFFSDAIPDIAQKKLFSTLVQDLARIFTPTQNAQKNYSLETNFCRLLEKKQGNFPQRRWQAVYYNWDDTNATFGTIRYRNFTNKTTFTLKPKQ